MDTWVIVGFVVLVGAGFAPLADDASLSEASASQLAAETSTHHVHIDGFAMDPDPLEVEVGDTVVWHNHDGASHTATDDGGGWDTGVLSTGDTTSITFDETASYTYHCEVHPSTMTGFELHVVEPNDAPTVAIETPEADELLTGEATIAGTASDPDGEVERVEVRIDGGGWRTATGTSEWSLGWDTEQVADGEHVMKARSHDGQDTSPIEDVTVRTDNPHPDLALTQLEADEGLTSTTITARVENVGEAAASASELELRYEADNAQDLIGTEAVPELGVGAVFEVTLEWDTRNKIGEFEVTAEADPADAVFDFEPGNDERSQTVCVPRAEGATCLVPGTEPPG